MRFKHFTEFPIKNFRTASLDDVVRYLSSDMVRNLKELFVGLHRLTLEDNFDSFVETVTLAAGEELAITNKFDNNIIPSSRIILSSDEGGLNITDGPTEWTTNFVYLKNYGASTGTIKVVFLR